MSGNVFECSVKHSFFNAHQERIQQAQNTVLRVSDAFSVAIQGQNDLSMGITLAALSQNNQNILDDIKESDKLLVQVDEHYKDIPNADSKGSDVWNSGSTIKVKFDEMRSQYENGRDVMLGRAEHMQVSYDQLILMLQEGNPVSAEDYDAVLQDLQTSTLDA